jgi:hypothetical protein
MRYSGQRNISETAPPPRKRHTPPSDQTDEAPGLIEREQVDIEREAPLEENQSIERIEPRDRPDPPVFED